MPPDNSTSKSEPSPLPKSSLDPNSILLSSFSTPTKKAMVWSLFQWSINNQLSWITCLWALSMQELLETVSSISSLAMLLKLMFTHSPISSKSQSLKDKLSLFLLIPYLASLALLNTVLANSETTFTCKVNTQTEPPLSSSSKLEHPSIKE